MRNDPDYSPDSEYETIKTNDPDGKKMKRQREAVFAKLEALGEKIKQITPHGSLDYDLFVIDPSNRDTTMDQFRDCLYDAIENLKTRVEELEDEARHNG